MFGKSGVTQKYNVCCMVVNHDHRARTRIRVVLLMEMQSDNKLTYERERTEMKMAQRGFIRRIQDGILYCDGLVHAFVGEMVEIYTAQTRENMIGYVFDIENNITKIALLWGQEQNLTVGNEVLRTNRVPQTRAGVGVLGQIITPLGECINKEDIDKLDFFLQMNYYSAYVDMERGAPGVTQREPVRIPLYTGSAAVDCFFPVGRGQRELIIGDNKTGKTTLALTAIINQKRLNMNSWLELSKNFRIIDNEPSDPSIGYTPCIYVAVGQKRAEIVRIRSTLVTFDASFYTCIVFTSADQLATLQYLAPYAGCAIGEWFRDKGYHALVVYDDLTQHAVAYRQMSLLLRRPPAREAYPADIFYVHSRLLERAAQLSFALGGGSLSALPIVETQLGDISSYIPTNVISITDGQIFLSRRIANTGRRPAVDFGLSVSRVGAASQVPVMASISKIAKISYSAYRRYAGIERVGGDIPTVIQYVIDRGKRLNVFMTQPQYVTAGLYQQAVGLYLFSSKFFDGIDVKYSKLCIKLLFSKKFAKIFLTGRARMMGMNPEEYEPMLMSVPFDQVQDDFDQLGRGMRKIMRDLQGVMKGNSSIEEQLCTFAESE